MHKKRDESQNHTYHIMSYKVQEQVPLMDADRNEQVVAWEGRGIDSERNWEAFLGKEMLLYLASDHGYINNS